MPDGTAPPCRSQTSSGIDWPADAGVRVLDATSAILVAASAQPDNCQLVRLIRRIQPRVYLSMATQASRLAINDALNVTCPVPQWHGMCQLLHQHLHGRVAVAQLAALQSICRQVASDCIARGWPAYDMAVIDREIEAYPERLQAPLRVSCTQTLGRIASARRVYDRFHGHVAWSGDYRALKAEQANRYTPVTRPAAMMA